MNLPHNNTLLHILLLSALKLTPQNACSQTYIYFSGKAQGTTYQIQCNPKGPIPDKFQIDSIFSDINTSLSLYDTNSLISKFNRSSLGMPADKHLKTVVHTAKKISVASQNAFDITVKPLMDAWGFGKDKISNPPTPQKLREIQKHVGSHHLVLRNDSLLKTNPNVQIDCNGIAQGYTVDLLASFLESYGISDYLVELGGEIRCKGLNAQGKAWSVGIEIASEDERNPWKIQPGHGAVTTSGIYRNKKSIKGSTYTHIIDPGTATPVTNSILSVTVFAPDAITADAIDNTCLVMGIEKSMDWISGMKHVGIFIQYLDKDKNIKFVRSEGFPPLLNMP